MSETFICSQCGGVHPMHEQYTIGEDDICPSCADEDTPLCYRCHHYAQQDKAIRDYYYRPEPLFYGEGIRYFGVELEDFFYCGEL